MKDVNDNQTADLLPTKRPRGRPRTGSALPGAVRQAKYRAKLAENTVTVTFNRDDLPALKLLLANPNPALQLERNTPILTRDAITPFPAKPAFEASRTKHRPGVSLPAFTGGLSGAILSDDRVLKI